MKFQEVLRRINFKVGTMDDISGRAINPIVTNRQIVDELNSQIRQYANITKGIQDIYSFSYNKNTVFVDAPPLALRSEAYSCVYVISNGVIFTMDMRSQADTYNQFRNNPLSGIPSWILPYHTGKTGKFNIFPSNFNNSKTTTLTSDISKDETTLPVVSTTGFIHNNGRITIGDEKIEYQYKDTTNFYRCLRGVENTISEYHTDKTTVTENNIIMYYSRLHKPIEIHDDNLVPPELLEREIEVVDEHMEGIIKAVAYNILVKLDAERAGIYKDDFIALYIQYKSDIKRGYYVGRMGTNIRDAYYLNESGAPMSSSIMF